MSKFRIKIISNYDLACTENVSFINTYSIYLSSSVVGECCKTSSPLIWLKSIALNKDNSVYITTGKNIGIYFDNKLGAEYLKHVKSNRTSSILDRTGPVNTPNPITMLNINLTGGVGLTLEDMNISYSAEEVIKHTLNKGMPVTFEDGKLNRTNSVIVSSLLIDDPVFKSRVILTLLEGSKFNDIYNTAITVFNTRQKLKPVIMPIGIYIDGRNLWHVLNIKTAFHQWIRARSSKYPSSYLEMFERERKGGKQTNFLLSLEFAKHIVEYTKVKHNL